jgi:hypothetical protein
MFPAVDLESRPSVALLERVAALAPRAVSSAELRDAIAASERLLSWVTGLQMRLLAEFARPGRAADIGDLITQFTEASMPGHVARDQRGEIHVDLLAALVADHGRRPGRR